MVASAVRCNSDALENGTPINGSSSQTKKFDITTLGSDTKQFDTKQFDTKQFDTKQPIDTFVHPPGFRSLARLATGQGEELDARFR
jgi:hypothetical protein